MRVSEDFRMFDWYKKVAPDHQLSKWGIRWLIALKRTEPEIVSIMDHTEYCAEKNTSQI